MSAFEVCICVIATLYTFIYGLDVCFFIYGLDVCFNIYQQRNDDEDDDDEELPEYVKRMYA